jgi:PAS domain S-box-containing protein
MTVPFGYELELLREAADLTLYRGRGSGNPLPVLVAALSAEQPSPQGLRRIEHEYSLRAELDPAWAARPLEVISHQGRTMLILMDPGGELLDRVLERKPGHRLELARCLRIAIGLAAAVGQFHRRGMVHRDIKPANVLVDDTGKVWLTGFGIASRVPHGRQSPIPPETIAGTLAYMAPEQTGRMNRSIDARSDLYSLGITLYRMLTGSLPFNATDPLEWVHCQIARQPVPPFARAAVPETLSAIAMRLLAKNPEERYQTASGLERDLRQCLVEWETKGGIDLFPLATHDIPDRLLIPEKLYGRESEVDALLAAFDRVVARGTPEVVLLSGYAGVGKSSVVNELHKALVSPRGLFASGKFDQYKRDIPYATLAQACQTLVRQVLVKSEAEVEQWRHSLLEAMGPNGQLMVSLIPELEFIIGKQPAVPELPPQDAQNRFRLVFRRFLGAFATREHPLALFLDDLQWLDRATLDLLEHWVSHAEIQHLLLIGAYRDNEVDSSHQLLRILSSIRDSDAKMVEIVLSPLALDGVDRLVCDALHCPRAAASPLAELIHEKTGGNAFFVVQFLTSLVDEDLLTLDPVTGVWQWEMHRIRAKGYTDNVVDLMAGKIQRLAAATQGVLKELACLGSVAEVGTLALARGETEQELHAALAEAVHAGLIFPEGSSYRFLHDRIQQAAYSLIPEECRAQVHFEIGHALLRRMTGEQLAEHLFDLANHLNRGAPLLVEHEEKVRVAEIDLLAGRKAKASAAYTSARTYFLSGMTLLEQKDWASHYELMFALHLECAECEFLTGRFDQAERLIEELLPRAATKVDLAAVYHLKIQLYTVKSQNPLAVESALVCMRLFDIHIPPHPTLEQVQAEYETVWQTLDMRPIESLIDQAMMTDPELQAAMRVLLVLANGAYTTDYHLFCLLQCRMVKLSMQHGTSGDSANAYGLFGFTLGPVSHRYREGYRFTKLGCDLVEKYGLIPYQARMSYVMALVAGWTQPISNTIDFNRSAFRTAMDTGDVTIACFGLIQSVSFLLLRGDPLDAVWREAEIGLDFVRKARFGDIADAIVNQQRLIATLQGRTTAFSSFSDGQFDEAVFEAQLTADRVTARISYWLFKLQGRFLAGGYLAALAAAQQAESVLGAAVGQITLLNYNYFTALTISALYENASGEEQCAWRARLTALQEQLREWADNNPSTFADKHALVSAEIARLEGRDSDAMRLYEQAIRSAREHGFVHNEAISHEAAAGFYLARGFETIAHAYLRKARNGYDRWGACGKVKQLDQRHPHLFEQAVPASTTPTTPTIGTAVRQLDVETVVKASQALASEIVLGHLIEKLMRIAVEYAGAERGLLILLRGEEPLIEAEVTTGHGQARVLVRQAAITPLDLPNSALHYVIRTRERVVMDDASIRNLYSEDEYVREKHLRSVLCLPIVKQSKLIGALYMENNLTPGAFTSERVAVLELLASQVAVSLENAILYSDLQRSEAFLAQGQSISHTGSFGWSVASGKIYWSKETYNIFAYDEAVPPTSELIAQRIHPDDRDQVRQVFEHAAREKTDFDLEHRLQMADGSVKHIHVIARSSNGAPGSLEYVGAVTDTTAVKQAEAALRRSENHLAEAQRLAHMGSWVWRVNGRQTLAFHLSEELYRIFGFDPEDGIPTRQQLSERIHPDDRDRWQEAIDRAIDKRSQYDLEYRIVLPGGFVKYIHVVGNPVLDAAGNLIEFLGSSTDITERKRSEDDLRRAFEEIQKLKDQLYQENIALREEIDKASMFEEIVGTSSALRAVLSRISKVAPTDSNVLITGETGTGKELVARAIHRRSRRAAHAFVSVNCAAVPRDLIASELFGHEKGAFTGATQRRIGRFELAEGGTIFLDEVGELTLETQIALLRVLQEREFERVGGAGSIRTNVRVIAATNRDLGAAIAESVFRSDLFYRLNVFPIEMPSLRERKEDIPLLVEYFLDRYGRKAGKSFETVSKKSLDLLQSYSWPGNIRELQNVIERSVIVCEPGNFSVDESWISRQPAAPQPSKGLDLFKKDPSQEKEIIEAALRECDGRVYGPLGAAARLGMPRTTLESKINALQINKNRFKTTHPPKSR